MSSKLQVDAVIANVRDLDGVLTTLERLTGLRPFYRSTLVVEGEPLPMALIKLGETTLEFIAWGRVDVPAGCSQITCVTAQVPGVTAGMYKLEPGIELALQPGPKPRVLAVFLRPETEKSVHETTVAPVGKSNVTSRIQLPLLLPLYTEKLKPTVSPGT